MDKDKALEESLRCPVCGQEMDDIAYEMTECPNGCFPEPVARELVNAMNAAIDQAFDDAFNDRMEADMEAREEYANMVS